MAIYQIFVLCPPWGISITFRGLFYTTTLHHCLHNIKRAGSTACADSSNSNLRVEPGVGQRQQTTAYAADEQEPDDGGAATVAFAQVA